MFKCLYLISFKHGFLQTYSSRWIFWYEQFYVFPITPKTSIVPLDDVVVSHDLVGRIFIILWFSLIAWFWWHRGFCAIKVLSRTEWGADRTTLLKLYRSLVRSKLDYGCIVYRSASKTALAKLDRVHNQGLRLSLGAFRSSPVETLYVEAHEPPLEIRREQLALQYTIKLKANPGNPAHDVVFNPIFPKYLCK